VRAVPRELWRSAVLAGRIERVARRRYFLRRDARREPGESTRISYLRVEPTLRWLGLQVGGAATHTRGVVNGLIDHGAAVRVFAADARLHRSGGSCRWLRAGPTPGAGCQLHRLLRAVIDGAPVRATSSISATRWAHTRARAARALGAPLVPGSTPRGWVERHWRRNLLLGRSLERLEQTNLREASLVVVVSDSLRRHVCAQGVPAERVLVNPNGVDVEALAPYRELTPSQWRTRLGVRNAPTVGFIGTFGHWHGVELLPDLAAAVPDAQWILIGGGGLFESVSAEMKRRGLGNRVSMPGVLERREALELLSSATSASRHMCRTRTARRSSAPRRSCSSTWGCAARSSPRISTRSAR
jgi:glycosyltransferase involved in cell wall biosynthesis